MKINNLINQNQIPPSAPNYFSIYRYIDDILENIINNIDFEDLIFDKITSHGYYWKKYCR